MGNLLEQFNVMQLDDKILNLHSNNWTRRSYIRNILTKDFLSELVSDGHSINYICLHILRQRGIKTQPSHLFDLCGEFGIPTMTCKERASTTDVKHRRATTTEQRYGVSHVMCKGTSFYKKTKQNGS